MQVFRHGARIHLNHVLPCDFLREGTLDGDVAILALLASLAEFSHLHAGFVPAISRLLVC